METKSIERLHLLHPICRDKAIQAYYRAVKATPAGVHPYIDETYRSFEESDKLYQQGRTAPGPIVTKAKGGQSFHNYNLALDFHLQLNGKDSWVVDHNWMLVVNIFKAHGFTSGLDFPGSFKDAPHLEYKDGFTLAQLYYKHKDGDFISGTNFVNIT